MGLGVQAVWMTGRKLQAANFRYAALAAVAAVAIALAQPQIVHGQTPASDPGRPATGASDGTVSDAGSARTTRPDRRKNKAIFPTFPANVNWARCS